MPYSFPCSSKMLIRYVAMVIICLALLAVHAGAQAPSIRITKDVTIVESAHESGAVARATQDLQSDFKKVFGHAPSVVERVQDAGPVALLIAENGNIPGALPCTSTKDREAFAFSEVPFHMNGTTKQVICLTGADVRGTIYAVYQFSQQYLGTDPMYLWTDKQPEKRQAITLPASFKQVFPSPVFHYRGIFTNDEDLLTGWVQPSAGEHSGIALKVWDNVFETILRLKGNMVVPGSWIFPDDDQVEAASRRGLIVNQHHATPVGLNAARWPKDVPYDFSTHPEILERAWRNAVAEYKADDDIVWSVGLRGLSDQTYADLDPTVRNNDPVLGERISSAIADQMAIVRARFPQAHFVANLWQEGDRLKREGYLKIPPEVTQVWADSGYGDVQDGGHIEPGEGMYFHVAMQNGEANQLTEMVPVSVIQQEFSRYIGSGATGFFLLNTSDIRPVAMTTRAAMETAWGGLPKGTADADGTYYQKWTKQEFGARAQDALASLYKEYFASAIPIVERDQARNKSASVEPREYGEEHYFTEATTLILNELSQGQVYRPIGQAPKWALPRVIAPIEGAALQARLQKDVAECTAAQDRWDSVWKHAVAAESLIDPARRPYYEAEVLTMIVLNREGNQMLLHISRAMQKHQAGHPGDAQGDAGQALQTFQTMHTYMSDAEYGKWKNWYRGDWLAGVARTQTYVQDYADHLRNAYAPLPAPMLWNDWEAYVHIMAYQGDRTVDVH